MIKMSVDEIKRLGRATQGVIVVRLKEGEIVSSLAPVAEPADDGNGAAE
jgi:DNA gyrase/topoisomerase IV subunit A